MTFGKSGRRANLVNFAPIVVSNTNVRTAARRPGRVLLRKPRLADLARLARAPVLRAALRRRAGRLNNARNTPVELRLLLAQRLHVPVCVPELGGGRGRQEPRGAQRAVQRRVVVLREDVEVVPERAAEELGLRGRD